LSLSTAIHVRRVVGGSLSPSKSPLHSWGSGPTFNTWFLGPTRVRNLSGISNGSAVCARLTIVTDRQTNRQTDRPRYSICNNRVDRTLRSTAMRPNNTSITRNCKQRQVVAIELEGYLHVHHFDFLRLSYSHTTSPITENFVIECCS